LYNLTVLLLEGKQMRFFILFFYSFSPLTSLPFSFSIFLFLSLSRFLQLQKVNDSHRKPRYRGGQWPRGPPSHAASSSSAVKARKRALVVGVGVASASSCCTSGEGAPRLRLGGPRGPDEEVVIVLLLQPRQDASFSSCLGAGGAAVAVVEIELVVAVVVVVIADALDVSVLVVRLLRPRLLSRGSQLVPHRGGARRRGSDESGSGRWIKRAAGAGQRSSDAGAGGPSSSASSPRRGDRLVAGLGGLRLHGIPQAGGRPARGAHRRLEWRAGEADGELVVVVVGGGGGGSGGSGDDDRG